MNSERVPQVRTLGDGMENTLSTKHPDIKLRANLFKTPSSSILKSMRPVEPSSKIIYLVPKYVPQDKKLGSFILSKPKEPKFIPYEPYKAAVEPMKCVRKAKAHPNITSTVKTSKNNVEIQELVTQMSEIRTSEMNLLKFSVTKEDELIPRQQWQREKKDYDTDIRNLKETIAHLENQLKFQAQVNSELKTLLVAAVGEDLESRVQHLTEDKLSLARALLNSANHLTSHQEQTEWLSGQCEVWRSKFLASSLMVEELAHWKSVLTHRANDLQEIITKIINEHQKLQKQMSKTFTYLDMIHEKNNNKRYNLKLGDIMELGTVNLELSENIASVSGISAKQHGGNGEKASVLSSTEKLALKILKNPVSLTSSQDVLCNALVGAAHSMTGEQRYLQNPLLHPCCSHCKGEVQDI